MGESRPARLSTQEKTTLGVVIAASLLVWGVLIAALTIAQNRPASAQDFVPSPVARLASPILLVPSPTIVPTGRATVTPTPPQPTATLTMTPLPTETPVPPTIVGNETTVIALLGIDESRRAKIWRTDSIVLVDA